MLPFSQFSSLQEFDDYIQKWVKAGPIEFTKGEFICFQQLLQSSLQIPGVCYKKIATFLDDIQENQGINLSRDTFKRMLRKAKARGILMVYTTVRENDSEASNLYVFNPFYEEEHQK